MPLFKIYNNKVTKIEKRNILEKDIQKIIEENLLEILDIYFLGTEFVTTDGRIDSVGLDKHGSPVIIEYKRSQNNSVINQATWYLEWLLDHKEKFEKLVEDKLKKHFVNELKDTMEPVDFPTIDWMNPRLICIAESYNKFDLGLVKFLPFKIELLKYRLYDDLLSIESENIQKGMRISERTNSLAIDEDSKPIREYGKEYLITDLFKDSWAESRELFEQIREKILELDSNIEEKITKLYISYKTENIFCEIIPQAKGLWIHVTIPIDNVMKNKIELHDVSEKGHWGTGETKFRVEKPSEVDLAVDYIKQSYEFGL